MSDIRFKCSCTTCKPVDGDSNGPNCACQICEYLKKKLGLVHTSLSTESQCSCSTCKNQVPATAVAESDCICEICKCFSDSYLEEPDSTPNRNVDSEVKVIVSPKDQEICPCTRFASKNTPCDYGCCGRMCTCVDCTKKIVYRTPERLPSQELLQMKELPVIEEPEDRKELAEMQKLEQTEEIPDIPQNQPQEIEVQSDELPAGIQLDKKKTSISCDCCFKICPQPLHKETQLGAGVPDTPVTPNTSACSKEEVIADISFTVSTKDIFVQTSVSIIKLKCDVANSTACLKDPSVRFNDLPDKDGTDPLPPPNQTSEKSICDCKECKCQVCKGKKLRDIATTGICDCGISTCDCNDDGPTSHQVKFYDQATHTDDGRTKDQPTQSISSTSRKARKRDVSGSCSPCCPISKKSCSTQKSLAFMIPKSVSKETVQVQLKSSCGYHFTEVKSTSSKIIQLCPSKKKVKKQKSSNCFKKIKKQLKNPFNKKCTPVKNDTSCQSYPKLQDQSFMCESCLMKEQKKPKKRKIKKKKKDICDCEVCTGKTRLKKI